MDENEESKDDLMVALGSMDESSGELQEITEACEQEDEEVIGLLLWLGGILKKIFLK